MPETLVEGKREVEGKKEVDGKREVEGKPLTNYIVMTQKMTVQNMRNLKKSNKANNDEPKSELDPKGMIN